MPTHRISAATLDTLAEIILSDEPISSFDLARQLDRPRALETARQASWLCRLGYTEKVNRGYVPTQSGLSLAASWLPQVQS